MPRKPHHTKDESYVIALYEEAMASANEEAPSEQSPVDRYQAGRRAGINQKGVDTICRLLIQANFIKKASETEVFFTPHGLKLAKQLIAD